MPSGTSDLQPEPHPERPLRAPSALGPILGVILFGVALFILHHELAAYHYHDVAARLRAIPVGRLVLALFLTVLSYVALTGYDALAVRFIRKPLPYNRVALASFIGYVFSHNAGASFLGGSAVRYRLFSYWGLTAADVARLLAFNVATFWLGYCAITGTVLLLAPLPHPEGLHLVVGSTRVLGVLLLGAVAAYACWSAFRRRPIRVRNFELSVPTPRYTAAQIAVGVVDWTIAGAALYVLLPADSPLGFLPFLGAYLLSQILGVLSNVPAGLGVFETSMVVLLGSRVPGAALLGSLLAYRAVYYLIPLVFAVAMMGAFETLQRRGKLQRAWRIVGDWMGAIVPPTFAAIVFLGGLILLASGATPAVAGRMAGIERFVPLPAVEVSHFLGSLIGLALILLARGVQQRADAAYHLSLILLSGGVVASLLKGFDYEEAGILCVMIISLLPCHRYFYRKTSLFAQSFTPAWIGAIAVSILGTVFLLFWSNKHVDYSNDLWWRFAVYSDASRSLRAMIGVLAGAVAFAIAYLMRPPPYKVHPPDAATLEKISGVVAASPRTSSNLALLGDKYFLLSEAADAFIMYGVQGRSWVSMGDPVGPPEAAEDLIWKFRELSNRYRGWTVFYEVGPDHIPLYIDLGLKLYKLGEEARVSLDRFSLEGGARKWMRHTRRHLEKEGCSFEVVPASAVRSLLPELARISDAWLAEKQTREKAFSLGAFSEDYLERFRLGLVKRDGTIVAFANLWMGADGAELSPDLMRYLPGAPQGVMDYLFIELLVWGKREGCRWFNLGMAPFSGLRDRALAPLWNRMGALLYRQGEQFYNFQGLRQYKDKFDPEWSPRYLASPGGLALPRVLANVAALISGGMRGVVAK